MKKVVLAVVLVIVLAGAGTPFLSGMMMERTLKQSISDINRIYSETGSDVSLEISRYDRRYSSSQIEWKIKTGLLKALYGIDEIVFLDQADHGFVRVVSHTSLEKNKWFMDFVNQELNGINPLEITTEYNYLGDIETTVALAGFSLTVEGDELDVMPGRLAFTMDKGINNIQAAGTWEGCAASDKLVMDNLSLSSKLEKLSAFIWDGNIEFAVNRILAEDGEDHFEMSNLKCDYVMDFDEAKNALSFNMRYGVDSIKAGEEKIDNAAIRIGINGIDSDGYKEFMQLYYQMIGDVMDDVASVSQQDSEEAKKALEEQMALVGLQMIGAYEKLMKQGLEIRISDLKAQLRQGQVSGDFSLGLKKDMTLAQFTPIMMEPAMALDVFSLKSDVSLPYTLVGDNQNLLNPIYPGMRTGLFIKKGEALTLNAETREGTLYLNGEEVQL